MSKTKLKNLSIVAITIILTLGFSISLQSLMASWSAPTAEAPANNPEAPLNVGNVGQSKNSGLIVNAGAISENGLIIRSGKVGIGTTSPSTALDLIQNTAIKVGNAYLSSGGDFLHLANNEWYDGVNWVSNGLAGKLLQFSGQTMNIYSHSSIGEHTPELTLNSQGNMGLGTLSPVAKLDLGVNQIKLASNDASCNNSTTGAIRYNPTDKKTEFCNGSSWYSVVTAAPVVQVMLLGGVHTADDCTAINGALHNIGTIGTTSVNYICKVRLASCPSQWTQQSGWYSTKSNFCPSSGCASCSTMFKPFGYLTPFDTCGYSQPGMVYCEMEGAASCPGCVGYTCTALVDEIGCK